MVAPLQTREAVASVLNLNPASCGTKVSPWPSHFPIRFHLSQDHGRNLAGLCKPNPEIVNETVL